MKPLEYRFSLDMNDEAAQVFCNVRNGDDCSKLIVSLQEDGRAYTFDDDVHAYFLAKKSDGNSLYTECPVENNTIIYEFTEQTAPVSGTVVCQFLLLSGSNRLTTPIFRLEVFDNVSIDPDSPESLPEYTALIDATQDAINATDEMRDLIEEIDRDFSSKMDLLSTVPVDITKETPDYTSTNFTKLSNNQLFLFEPSTPFDRATIELWNKINSNSAIRISNIGVPFRRYKTCFVDGDLSVPSTALFMADAVDPEILYDVKTSSEYGPKDGCMFYLRDSRRGYMYESQYWIHIDGRISSRNRIRPNGDISVNWSQFNDFVTDSYTKAETNTLLSAKENILNKVTSLSSSSTDSQYPTAKCVYDIIGDIESLLAEV